MIHFTIDQLEVLEAIHGLGSFAAAAGKLHRATSAVSYAVKSLESALGVRVFDRTGRRVKLTPAGELALEAAREVLERSRQLEKIGRDLRGGWEAQLRVVIDGVLPLAPLMRALQRFTARGLPTKMRLMVEYLSGVGHRFEREDAQLMLAADPKPSPRLTMRPLPPVEMILLAHADHPVHARGEVDRDVLASFVELIVADSGDRDAAPPTRLAYIGSPHLFELTDFHSKREALESGIGFGWLPAHLAVASIAEGRLREVRFAEGSRYVLQPALVHARGTVLGPAGRQLVEDIEAELAAGWGEQAQRPKRMHRPKRRRATP